MTKHITAEYLLNPQHLVTVNLIGCGGTGSQVLSLLARMNEALIGLGHCGIHVYAWDGDAVTDANVGRQLFSPADVGLNKAVVLVSRINRYFGYNWEARNEHYNLTDMANITITCVDKAKTRVEIGANLKYPTAGTEPHERAYYWMDFGNGKSTGQVVLGTFNVKAAPPVEGIKQYLPDVLELFPDLYTMTEEDNTPSCSIAQALGRQDLFINSTLANMGMAILWKLFRQGWIEEHGLYLNLDTMIVNPIKIKP